MVVLVRLCLWLLALVCGLQMSHAQVLPQTGFTFTNPKKKWVRLPIEIHHNLILIPIKINNKLEVNFILDSGSRTTIFTEPLLLTLANVKPARRTIKLQGLGKGETITAQLVEGVRLSMPFVEGENMSMIVLPPDLISFSELFGKPVYGIIGHDFFNKFVVEINYLHKYLKLYQPQHYHKPHKAETVPFELIQGKPYINAVLTDAQNDTVQVRLLADTGATQALTVFYERITIPPKNIDAFLGRGLGGEIMGKLARLPQLQIGNFVLPNPVVGFPDAQSLQLATEKGERWDGNLGGDALSRFTVVFNYPNQELYLKKNRKFNAPYEYDISGVQLETKAPDFKRVIVGYVRPNSAAARAGVVQGAEVVSINHTPAAEVTIGELFHILNRKPGKKLKMQLKTNGKTFTVQFTPNADI